MAQVFSSSEEDEHTMYVARFYWRKVLLTARLRGFEGTVPPHFYGEMSKTELGCHILQEKGHFAEFAQFIRQHGHESEDAELIMKLKSVLWAVVSSETESFILPFLTAISCR